jgi:uncharacterized membrane protein
VIGICFRFINLDRKVYWVDEVYTSLRMSGYTEAEFVQEVFTGQEIRASDLQQYQHPNSEKSWADTLESLKGNAEHVPLYFLLARFWTEQFGYSIATIRSLSALISLLIFPCLYWLCLELFRAPPTAWAALLLVAVSPLHVLYAQEARQYSLWTVTILFSSAALLWAMRAKTRVSWGTYGLTVAFGFYTHLLFGMVAIAHSLYIAILEKFRLNRTTRSYLAAFGVGLLAFTPWILVVLTSLDQINVTTAFLTETYSLSNLIDIWFLNLNRIFIDRELGAANVFLVLLVVCALYFLCRTTPNRIRWFILFLVGIPFLGLALPDLIVGGQRSLRIRYLIPCYLGMQIAIAHLLVTPIIQNSKLKTFSQILFVLLISAGILTISISSQSQVWWNKSVPKSYYFPSVAYLINQVDQPLVISDGDPITILSFSYLLKPETRLQLVTHPRELRVSKELNDAFLLTPSRALRAKLTRRQNYHVVSVYKDRGVIHLWQLR